MVPRLLIVEDEMTLARNLARALERAGIAVRVATNGQEARRTLNGGRFDILCTWTCASRLQRT